MRHIYQSEWRWYKWKTSAETKKIKNTNWMTTKTILVIWLQENHFAFHTNVCILYLKKKKKNLNAETFAQKSKWKKNHQEYFGIIGSNQSHTHASQLNKYFGKNRWNVILPLLCSWIIHMSIFIKIIWILMAYVDSNASYVSISKLKLAD